MKTLEACFALDFSKVNFLERKKSIKKEKTIITGPSKVGKSYLIYDYLSSLPANKYIYIDFKNKKNDLKEIKESLTVFIKENNIEVLVLENFDFSFPLPACTSIIITTSSYKKVEPFVNIELLPLDFEEFLLHDNRHQNITQSFDYFFKHGNLPELISIDEFKKETRAQEILALSTKDETSLEILKILILSIDEKKSIFQLFTSMKKNQKISKDKFYEVCSFYEKNKTIFFIPKYGQEKAVKKIYSYNYAFLNSISHDKKFKNEFTNIVFLEIYKTSEQIFYLDSFDFYIPSLDSAILCIPFFNPFLEKNIKKKISSTIEKYKIKEVYLITIANSGDFICDNLKIQVMPFYEWALL